MRIEEAINVRLKKGENSSTVPLGNNPVTDVELAYLSALTEASPSEEAARLKFLKEADLEAGDEAGAQKWSKREDDKREDASRAGEEQRSKSENASNSLLDMWKETVLRAAKLPNNQLLVEYLRPYEGTDDSIGHVFSNFVSERTLPIFLKRVKATPIPLQQISERRMRNPDPSSQQFLQISEGYILPQVMGVEIVGAINESSIPKGQGAPQIVWAARRSLLRKSF